MSNEAERRPWEQLPGEPDAAYARFLHYRDLGPTRTIDDAFRVYEAKRTHTNPVKPRTPSQWQKDSMRWRWVRRARAWDLFVLLSAGSDATEAYLRVITIFARNALDALQSGTLMRPMTFDDAVKAIDLLSKVISKEALDACFTRLKRDYDAATNEERVIDPGGGQ